MTRLPSWAPRVLALPVTGAGAGRSRDRTWVQVCARSLLALTAYLTLFESRPRHLVAMLPVLLLLTGPTARPGRQGDAAGPVRFVAL